MAASIKGVQDTRPVLKTSSSLETPKVNSNMKIIRTKYKMKKQYSSPMLDSFASKDIHRKSTPTHKDQTKSGSSAGCKQSSRYKLVKVAPNTSSSPSVLHHKSVKKTRVSVNTRYKMVKGLSQKPCKPGHSVIPHHSQLKLNRKASGKKSHSVIPHRSQLKLCRKQNVKSGSRKHSDRHHYHAKKSTHKIGKILFGY